MVTIFHRRRAEHLPRLLRIGRTARRHSSACVGVMARRLPPLSHARDAEFWRQRINKERRDADESPRRYPPQRPAVTPMSALGPAPGFNKQPFGSVLGRNAATPTSLGAAPFGRITDPHRPATSIVPLPPPVLISRNPMFSRELRNGWHEPPLIMSHGYNEPPRVFRKFLEASTHSRNNPASPLLHVRAHTLPTFLSSH